MPSPLRVLMSYAENIHGSGALNATIDSLTLFLAIKSVTIVEELPALESEYCT